MIEFLSQFFPNAMNDLPGIWTATIETFQMVFIAGGISLVFGIVFGVILIVTRKDGILENLFIWRILDITTNLFRSIPFIILAIALSDLSRTIVGTTIGVKGAIVPLVFGTVPFFARQIESSLAEIDPGLVEASQAMGDSPLQTIIHVYLRESIPGIIRGTSITIVSLIGFSAIVGTIGAGGLGAYALNHGYYRHLPDVTVFIIILILIIITIIQAISDYFVDKTTH